MSREVMLVGVGSGCFLRACHVNTAITRASRVNYEPFFRGALGEYLYNSYRY